MTAVRVTCASTTNYPTKRAAVCLTTMSRSAWVPVNTGMSMGTCREYGLFKRTPKFLSPLSKSKMKTPICMSPTRAAERAIKGKVNSFFCLVKIIFDEMMCERRPTLIGPGIVKIVKDRDQNVEDVAALQDEKQELL